MQEFSNSLSVDIYAFLLKSFLNSDGPITSMVSFKYRLDFVLIDFIFKKTLIGCPLKIFIVS